MYMVSYVMYHQCKILELLLSSQAITFCMVEPKVFGVIMGGVSPPPPYVQKMHTSTHTTSTSRKFQIMVKFTGQSTIVRPQYGTYVTRLALRICRWLLDFWKICGPL
jgi:hypothetical protein